MSSTNASPKFKQQNVHTQSRHRLSREERYMQLIETAWKIIREEGTDALTLGQLAEQSGVTKPVVYNHFGTRSGLFAALYQAFDAQQVALMDAALQASESTLISKANIVASSYIDCVLNQGREIPGVIAALASSPELEKIKFEYQKSFINKCHTLFTPFSKHPISLASLWAMLGAAETLSYAAVINVITATEAKEELLAIILAMVDRN